MRQIVVLACAVLAVVGSAVGSGAFGGVRIADASGGALGADATLIAPAVPAFAIWTPIYLGLVCYAVWQCLPAHKTDSRQRALGYPIAATMLLNAAWILTVQAGGLAASVVVIVVLLSLLGYVFRASQRRPAQTRVEIVVLDGTMGLYLGWVSVATAANVTAALVAGGFRGFGWPADSWAILVLAVTGVVGLLLAGSGRGRLAPAAALCWGLAWIAVSRIAGGLESGPAAVAAIVAAVVIGAGTAAARLASRPGSRGVHRRPADTGINDGARRENA